MHLPIVGITMGDPTGIGPEIIVKAFARDDLFQVCRPVVLGDPGVLAKTLRMLRVDMAPAQLGLEVCDGVPAEGYRPGKIPVVPLSRLDADALEFGRPDRACGKAMVTYVEQAVEWLRGGTLDAMTTCPINKQAMNEAGHPFAGHTELLAHLAGVPSVAMMFVSSRWKVVLVTIHVALQEVPALITAGLVLSKIKMADEGLRNFFGIDRPRIAVLGLNPHCGEGGLLGKEEEREILPAVRAAQSQGLNAEGPFPADSFFTLSGHRGTFDAVVSMYHDQGLIAMKMVDAREAVNVTLGLPFIRTSVAHGTAYDIAGRGVADPTNLIHATRAAANLSKLRRKRY